MRSDTNAIYLLHLFDINPVLRLQSGKVAHVPVSFLRFLQALIFSTSCHGDVLYILQNFGILAVGQLFDFTITKVQWDFHRVNDTAYTPGHEKWVTLSRYAVYYVHYVHSAVLLPYGVHLSVTLRCRGHISCVTSKVITRG